VEAIARAVEQSAGNALFLEEIIRSMAEGKTETPSETVVAMLQARLSRLDGNVRRAVRAAALLGQTFWRGGVAALLGLADTAPELDSWLSALVDAEMISPHADSRLVGQKEYGFRHALVRDAAYDLLTDSDLVTGNRLAAEFLESAGEPNFAVIAEHFQRGNDLPRAASHYVRAAEAALDTLALNLSMRHIAAGVACGASGKELGRLRACEAYCSFHLGQIDRCAESGLAALGLLRPGCRARGRALNVAIVAAILGAPEAQAQLPSMSAELIQTDPESGAESAYGEGLAYLGGVLSISAPTQHWQPAVARLESLASRLANRDSSIQLYLLLIRAHTGIHASPRPWMVLKAAEEAWRIALEVGDTFNAMIGVSLDLVWTWRGLGDDDKAMSFLESQRSLAESVAGTLAGALYPVNIASILAARADPASRQQALHLAGEALSVQSSVPPVSTLAYDSLARVYLQQGKPSEAEAAARQALDCLRPIPNYAPQLRAPLIHALLAQGRAADARSVAEDGLAFLQQFGSAGYAEVELRLAISEAFAAANEPRRAHSELAEALRQIQLRTDDIIDPFWRNSYLTRNPYCVRAQQLAKEWGMDPAVK
jgi:tetratricopeptide (TPR) repeat protein